MSYADGLSDEMSDAIGSDPNNNTVGYVASQTLTNPVQDNSNDNVLGITAQKASQALQKASQQSPLGSPYAGPIGWTERISSLARFFNNPERGNQYTTDLKKPIPTQATKAVDPQEFYAKWYESMRRFAEAEEVASRGQTQVRTR